MFRFYFCFLFRTNFLYFCIYYSISGRICLDMFKKNCYHGVMSKFFILTAVPLLIFASCDHNSAQTRYQPATNSVYNVPLRVGGKNILVQVVKTAKEMQQGLSGRERLAEDQGMLFDFGASQAPSFWMKDMKFGLDFIWVSGGRVAGVTPDVPFPANNTSDDQLKLYNPPSPVNWVLEVNAGWAMANKIKIGDPVE
jgi:uncharacterized membrane protein (UPF0127 family)